MSDTPPPDTKIGSTFKKYAAHRRSHEKSVAQTNASTWVAMVTALIGGFVALSTYRADVAKKIDQSVEKSFEMIGTWNSESLTGPRKRVLSYVYARRACDARLFSRDLTDDDFVRVIEFFDLVNACIRADLCDEDTARTFFGPHANFQWPVLERTVNQMREDTFAVRSDPNFANGMAALALEPIATEPCEGNF